MKRCRNKTETPATKYHRLSLLLSVLLCSSTVCCEVLNTKCTLTRQACQNQKINELKFVISTEVCTLFWVASQKTSFNALPSLPTSSYKAAAYVGPRLDLFLCVHCRACAVVSRLFSRSEPERARGRAIRHCPVIKYVSHRLDKQNYKNAEMTEYKGLIVI